ncbi:MAG: NACHT domain-containing protein [Actinomycetota bacterium]
MSLDLVVTAIGSRLIEWNSTTVVGSVLQGVSTSLPATELEKALKAAMMAAHRREKRLFSQAEKEPIHGLLNRFFNENFQVTQELQKPFNDTQKIQIDILKEAFQKALESSPEITVNKSLIEPWLRTFAQAYTDETRAASFNLGREEYFKQVLAQCEENQFLGANQQEAVPSLPQTFILPEVTEELKVGDNQQLPARKFSVEQILGRIGSHKILFLGEPGIGKTTLVDYIKFSLASQKSQWMPIQIYLRDLAKKPEQSILDYLQEFAKIHLNLPNLPLGFFEYWLEQGRGLILIEGLDEIADSVEQRKAEQLEEFIEEYEHNPALITAREDGYLRKLFGRTKLLSYRIQPFDSAKIHQFIKQWFNLQEEEESIEKLQHRDILQQALAERKWLQELAKNPLILSLIAQNHRYDSPLPKKRAEIDTLLIQGLLKNWENLAETCSLTLAELERFMQHLAYGMHASGNTRIDRGQLLEFLTEAIATLQQISTERAATKAEQFIHSIHQTTGILNPQGEGCYAFAHKHLQEYLAAGELLSRQEQEGWTVVQSHLQTDLYDPHWQEILFLLIAQQPPQTATQSLEEILQQPDLYEPWLHRHLLFAGHCLAEGAIVSDNAATDILSQLVALEISGSEQIGKKVSAEIFQILCRLKKTPYADRLRELLQTTGDSREVDRLQTYREVQADTEQAIAPLLGRLQDRDATVRARCAKAIGQLGDTSEWVVQALLGRFQDWDPGVRASAAAALGQLKVTPQVAGAPLLSLLGDREAQVRASAALALGQISQSSPTIMPPLLSLLGDREAQVRASAAAALGEIGDRSETILHSILSLLKDGEAQVRASAAVTVGKLGNGSEWLMEILLNVLQDQEPEVRAHAAVALGWLNHHSPLLMQILEKTMREDESAEVRSQAALALVKLGEPAREVASAIVAWIEQHPDIVTVGPLIDALWELLPAFL